MLRILSMTIRKIFLKCVKYFWKFRGKIKNFPDLENFQIFHFSSKNELFFDCEFFSELRNIFGYSFDVELSDLSIYEVYDAQLRKLKKLQRVEGMCTEKKPGFTTIQKKVAIYITL